MTGIALLVALLLCGCSVPSLSPPDSMDDADLPAGGESDLFVPGVEPGEVVFRTDDPRYRSPYGYTIWGLRGPAVDSFSALEMVCTRISGHGAAGYGLLFCHGVSGEAEETMLVVMINTDGEYTVGEVVGDRFTSFVGWSESSALARGYNQANRVRVERSGDLFTLFLNGAETVSFRDDEAPLHSGGRNGCIVVLSPLDLSEAYPVVELRFREVP